MSYAHVPPEAMTFEFYPAVAPIESTPTLNPYDSQTAAVEEQLAGAQGSFAFEPEFMAAHGLGNYLLRSSRFTERADWAFGRQDSSYGVFFGELELTIDNDDVATVPVAAKPYGVIERERAVHEYAALEYFKDHSELRTFQPIGFFVDEIGNPVLLTVFEDAVVSLDNVDWAKSGDSPLDEHYDLFTALQKSAQILARLHVNGFNHRDAQIKNMAVDTDHGAVRLIDLTTLKTVDSTADEQTIAWQNAVRDDLVTLVRSVRRRGYLADETEGNARDMIRMALLSPHNSIIRHPSNSARVNRVSVHAVEDISEEILAGV